MAGFSGLLHHGARASVANGHRTQPVGTIEVSASQLSPGASRTEHALLSCQYTLETNLTHDTARCSAPKLRSPDCACRSVALLAVVPLVGSAN